MTLYYENGNNPLRIRMPEAWRQAINKQATAAGVSDAEWVRQLILEALPKSVAKKLPPVSAGRPRKDQTG